MAARPRRRFGVTLLAAAALAGCGHQGPDYSLKTPPDIVVARPIETPVPPAAKGAGRASVPHPTQRRPPPPPPRPGRRPPGPARAAGPGAAPRGPAPGAPPSPPPPAIV